MLNYNPSQLTDNVTLLEEFHKIQSYLTEHPLYQQYGSQAIYQAGKTDYSLDTVIKPEGSKLGVGDVVIFSNVYYGIVTAVSETTFTIETAVNFRGTQGEQGAQGVPGPQGPTGATGPAGKDGQDGFGTFAVFVTQKLIPTNTIVVPLGAYKRPAIDDTVILLSSYTEQYVAYSQIAMSTIKSYDALNGQATVRIVNVIDTKGATGSKGDKGDTGAQGPQGEAGNAMYIYNGLLDASVVDVQVSQITIPIGRTLQAEDILISSYESSIGAMAQVVAIADGVASVDFIGQISTGGGGTTLNKYTYTTSDSTSSYARFFNIVKNAKIIHYIQDSDYTPVNFSFETSTIMRLYRMKLAYAGGDNPSMTGQFIRHSISKNTGKGAAEVLKIVNTLTGGTNTISSTGTQTPSAYYKYTVVYYNDTEITA